MLKILLCKFSFLIAAFVRRMLSIISKLVIRRVWLKMKKLIITILIMSASLSFGQFKNESKKLPSIKDRLTHNTPSSLFLGFFHPENFKMSHSVGMSFSTSGGNNIMLGTYTGSMFYKIADNLNISVDASLVTSPYNSFGNKFSKSINGIYINRAQINYRPSKNTIITLQYFNPISERFSPYGWGSGSYSGNYQNSFLYDEFGR